MKRILITIIALAGTAYAAQNTHIPSFVDGRVSSVSGLTSEIRYASQHSFAALSSLDGSRSISVSYGRFQPVNWYRSVGIAARTRYNIQTDASTLGIEVLQEGFVPFSHNLLRSSLRVGASYTTGSDRFGLYTRFSVIPTLVQFGMPLTVERSPDTGEWGGSLGLRYQW